MLEFKLRCWDERGVVGRRAKLASCRVQLGAPLKPVAGLEEGADEGGFGLAWLPVVRPVDGCG